MTINSWLSTKICST